MTGEAIWKDVVVVVVVVVVSMSKTGICVERP
jgi:hypothetical protein